MCRLDVSRSLKQLERHMQVSEVGMADQHRVLVVVTDLHGGFLRCIGLRLRMATLVCGRVVVLYCWNRGEVDLARMRMASNPFSCSCSTFAHTVSFFSAVGSLSLIHRRSVPILSVDLLNLR